jgi:hypothetical protein
MQRIELARLDVGRDTVVRMEPLAGRQKPLANARCDRQIGSAPFMFVVSASALLIEWTQDPAAAL